MSEQKVSKRYCNSLLDTAIEKNILDFVYKDMELISASLESSRQLSAMLLNPVIKSNIKLSVLESIFKDRIHIETFNFLSFLILKGRENLLSNISKEFLELRDDYLGIVSVKVSSAVSLDDTQIKNFQIKLEKLLQKKVKFIFKIDTSVLGGFIAEVNDTVYDASLKHQLALLKKKFLSSSVSVN